MLPQGHQSDSMTPDKGIHCRLRADDMTEIFAWIHYCIAKGITPTRTRQSIVGHLERTRQRHFTLAQIDQKIKDLWNFNAKRDTDRPTDRPDYLFVYRAGTKALSYFDHREAAKNTVRARVQRMMREPVFKPSKRARQRNRRRRKVKHISPSVEVVDRSFQRVIVELPLDSTQENSTQDSSPLQVPSSPSKAPEGFESRETSVTLSAVSDNDHPESLSSSTRLATNSVLEDPPTPEAGYPEVNPELFLTPAKKPTQLTSIRPLTRMPVLLADNRSSCSRNECDLIRQLLADRERDMQYFRLEWSKAQDTIRTLERELECEGHRRAILVKACRDPAEITLKHYLKEIEIQKSQLMDRDFLRPFTTQAGREHIPFDEKYFQKHMDIIRNGIEDFMSCAETSRMCNNVEWEKVSDDLRLLFQRVFGESENALQSISFHSLLRSLMSAAVCEYVFERDVQEHFLASTPLRETMLSHLTTQDGEDVARNLDFAAHYTLIESEYFQEELIPRRAKALAARISATIAPLLGLQRTLGMWKVDIMKKWNGKRAALEKILVSALSIKVRALVSKDVFEVVFPQQGHKHDRELMEVEDLKRDDGGSLPGQASLVRLCLVPGLRKYAFDRRLVDYNSFRKPGSGLEGPSDRIAKALVIRY